jgi:hypothetical protein
VTYWEGFRVAGLLVFLTAGGSEQLGYALPHQTQGGEGDEKHEQVRGLEYFVHPPRHGLSKSLLDSNAIPRGGTACFRL